MTSENWGVWSERQSIGHAISRSLALGASLRMGRSSISSFDCVLYPSLKSYRLSHSILILSQDLSYCVKC